MISFYFNFINSTINNLTKTLLKILMIIYASLSFILIFCLDFTPLPQKSFSSIEQIDRTSSISGINNC